MRKKFFGLIKLIFFSLFQEIVSDQCAFLNRCLKIVLNRKVRTLQHDFVVDMRTFKNFDVTNDVNDDINFDDVQGPIL